jgi:WD40 repeat protein/serine/threonine protein kinase
MARRDRFDRKDDENSLESAKPSGGQTLDSAAQLDEYDDEFDGEDFDVTGSESGSALANSSGSVALDDDDESFAETVIEDSVDEAARLIESGVGNWPGSAPETPHASRDTSDCAEGLTDEDQRRQNSPLTGLGVSPEDSSYAPPRRVGDFTQTLSHRALDDAELAKWMNILSEIRADAQDPDGAPSRAMSSPAEAVGAPAPSELPSPARTSSPEAATFSGTHRVSDESAEITGSETPPPSASGRGTVDAGSQVAAGDDLDSCTFGETDAHKLRQASREAEGGALEARLRIRQRPIEGGPPFGAANDPEYSVISKLAEGGMGEVYVARQTSLDRKLAIKTLKQLKPRQKEKLEAAGRLSETMRVRRQMFLSEAAVTANLVHPNIVSIHDLGETRDGTPYYSMKLVNGTAWNSEIGSLSLEENIDVLLKVADAVAYAHHNGVINRDLKPENVILGEYGEVVVLDWGLAIGTGGKSAGIQAGPSDSTSLGQGTPVYMAPEMLLGPLSEIGDWSDIYLLGAILFEIVTGAPPHEFAKADDMRAFHRQLAVIVGKNVIRDVKQSGELLDIARRAMHTDRHQRFASVQEFQAAVRAALRHSESERLTERALDMLAKNPGYTEYQNALVLLEEAIREWPENQRAQEELSQARIRCGRLALDRGDHDFGLQLLASETTSDAVTIQKKLQRGKRRRARTRKTIAALLILLVTGGVTSVATILNANLSAAEAKEEERLAKENAKTTIANAEQREAKADQRVIEADEKVRQAKENAKKLVADAKLEADKKVDEANQEVEQAKTNANKLVADAQIEAGKKVALADENARKLVADAQVEADKKVKLAEENAKTLVDDANRKVKDANEQIKRAQQNADILVAAAEDEGKFLALFGQAMGYERTGEYPAAIEKLDAILLLDIKPDRKAKVQSFIRRLKANAVEAAGPILKGRLSQSRQLFAYADKTGTVHLQRLNTGGRLGAAVATIPTKTVVDAIEIAPDETWLSLAMGGTTPGIRFWSIRGGNPIPSVKVSDVEGRVTAMTTALDGRWLITGDENGWLRIYESSTGALLKAQQVSNQQNGNEIVDVAALDDEDAVLYLVGGKCYALPLEEAPEGGVAGLELTSQTQLQLPLEPKGIRDAFSRIVISPDKHWLALAQKNRVILAMHRGATNENRFPFALPQDQPLEHWPLQANLGDINDLGFSADSTQLVTASQDYLVNVWELKPAKPMNQAAVPASLSLRLRGHGGPVLACGFLAQRDRIVSAGQDAFVRLWDAASYEQQRAEQMRQFEELLNLKQPEATASLNGGIHRSPVSRMVDRTAASTATVSTTRASRRLADVFRVVAYQSEETAATSSETETATAAPIVLNRHQGQVKTARLSQDGTKLITGGEDRLARVWDATNGQPLKGPEGFPAAFQADPAFEEGHLLNGAQVRYVPGRPGLLLTSGYDATMSLWDASTEKPGAGHQLARLRDVGLLNSFAFSRDGALLMTSASPDGARLWNVDAVLKSASPQPIREFPGLDEKPVSAVAISPDQTRFAAGTRGGTLAIWIGTESEPAFLRRQAHSRSTVSAAEFVDDSHLLTAGVDGQVILWKLSEEDGALSVTQERVYDHGQGDTTGAATLLAVSPDYTQFLTVTYPPQRAGTEQTLHLWNVAEPAPVRRVPMKKVSAGQQAIAGITSVAWSADGSRAGVVADGVLRVFDTADWSLVQRLSDVDGKAIPTGVAFPPDQPEGQQFATFDGYRAHLWSLAEDGKADHVVSFRPHATILAADFSGDGKFVVTGSRSLRVFNGDHTSADYGRSLYKEENPHSGPVSTVVFAPGKSYRFLTASTDASAKVWEWSAENSTLRLIRELSGHQGAVRQAAWLPDGKRVLTVGDDGQPRLWTVDVADAAPIILLIPEPEQYQLFSCAVSSDGERIAVGGIDTRDDTSVGWVWKRDGAAFVSHCLVASEHGIGGVTAATFIPGTQLLITGGADGQVYQSVLPEVESGATQLEVAIDSIERLIGGGRLKAHNGAITRVSADSRGRVVTSSDDGDVVIWSNFVSGVTDAAVPAEKAAPPDNDST